MTTQYDEYGQIDRLYNGVKKMQRDCGNPFSNNHRTCLTQKELMADLDNILYVYLDHTEYDLYAEVVMGESKPTVLRDYAVVAFLDSKKRVDLAENAIRKMSFSLELQLSMCRDLASIRPAHLAPKFFYVCGESDFVMIEIDIYTGKELRRETITADMTTDRNWLPVWSKLGICNLRENLKKWLKNKKNLV